MNIVTIMRASVVLLCSCLSLVFIPGVCLSKDFSCEDNRCGKSIDHADIMNECTSVIDRCSGEPKIKALLKRGFANAFASFLYSDGTIPMSDAKKHFYWALTDFNQVLTLRPKNADAHLQIGQLYFQWRDYNGALENVSKAIEYDSFTTRGSCFSYNLRKQIYEKMGKRDLANKNQMMQDECERLHPE